MCAKIIRLNKMAKEIETIAPETSAASILWPAALCHFLLAFPNILLAIKLKSGEAESIATSERAGITQVLPGYQLARLIGSCLVACVAKTTKMAAQQQQQELGTTQTTTTLGGKKCQKA